MKGTKVIKRPGPPNLPRLVRLELLYNLSELDNHSSKSEALVTGGGYNMCAHQAQGLPHSRFSINVNQVNDHSRNLM